MSQIPLASHPLNNGLDLVLFDQSKKIAGDRWHVSIHAEIRIPVERQWFGPNGIDSKKFEALSGALGQEVVFRQRGERNFVSDEQKPKIVRDICERAMKMSDQYCSSDLFAAKFIMKAYAEHMKRR